MRLDRGPMRAAAPDRPFPRGESAWRPRRGILAALLGAALAVGAVAAPAMADEAVEPAPSIPVPVLVLGDCDATISLTELTAGRVYDIAVTNEAGGYVLQRAYAADGPVLDSFLTVPAGVHTVTVTDVAAPDVRAERVIDVAPCAPAPSVTAQPSAAGEVPTIVIQPASCDLLGATDVRVEVQGLGAGTYRAGVTADGAPVPGLADLSLTASSNAGVFPDLTNGGTYSVWVAEPRGAVVATATTTLAECDLPTLAEPGQADPTGLETAALAQTGASPVLPLVLAALAALQAGALVGAVPLLRRRSA